MNKAYIENEKVKINIKKKGIAQFFLSCNPLFSFRKPNLVLSQIGLEQLTTRIGS